MCGPRRGRWTFGARCTLNARHVCPISGFKPRGIAYMGKFSSPLLHLAIRNNTVHVAHLTTGPCGADLYAFAVNLRPGFVQSGGGLSPGRASELRRHQTLRVELEEAGDGPRVVSGGAS
ncbi:hypothetical protein ROHU_027903 [Labeo rohita]|uniref:Uncharacterized protein n=1 Tax=Labeo rohita TaxID=84645 RepID=A0A498M5A4_LABRO|nr:hypothetical protein ROHU_027903 [Labeo rohita]